MLTQEGCLTRRRRLWKAVAEDLEWLLIADPRHVHYLANFWVNPLSFSGGERGLLLLERDGGATLIGDNFAIRSSAVTPYVDREIIEDWYDHRHSVINRDHALCGASNRFPNASTGGRERLKRNGCLMGPGNYWDWIANRIRWWRKQAVPGSSRRIWEPASASFAGRKNPMRSPC